MFHLLPQEFEQSVSLDSLEYYPGNPRRGDIPGIRDSISRIGWFGCLYVQKSTRHILAGNQSCLSAMSEGAEQLPVLWIDCDDNTAKKIVLAANRLADRGDYDLEDLSNMLKELDDMDTLQGTGYETDDLEKLLADLDAEERERQRSTSNVSVLFSSESEEWYTPQQFIEAARDVMGVIDLDPASCEFANQIVKAQKIYTAEDNGLLQEWSGNIWLNPPYGKGRDPIDGKEKSNQLIWTAKLIDTIRSGRSKQACMLVTSVTETKFFQSLLNASAMVCLPDSRIQFYNDGPLKRGNLKGSGIFYFGPDVRIFHRAFESFGTMMERSRFYDDK